MRPTLDRAPPESEAIVSLPTQIRARASLSTDGAAVTGKRATDATQPASPGPRPFSEHGGEQQTHPTGPSFRVGQPSADGLYVGLYHQAQTEIRWLQALIDVQAELQCSEDRDAVEVIVHAARQAASATTALILVPDAARDTDLTVAARAGETLDLEHQHSLKASSRLAIDSAEAVVGPANLLQPPRHTPNADDTTELASSVLAVPLQIHGQRGALVLVRTPHEPPLGPADAAAAESYAIQAGAAAHLCGEARAARSTALWADRERIAQDIHDHVIQQLFAAELQLTALSQLFGNDRLSDAAQRVLHTVNGIDQAIRQLRKTIFDLKPHAGP